MKFKKVLAAILSASMVVSSFSAAGIANPTVVEAASVVYSATIKNGTANVVSSSSPEGSMSVVYGNSVELQAAVEKIGTATTTTGNAVYTWKVLNSDGTPYKVNNQDVTGTDANFTFTPSGNAGTEYTVAVTVGQNYTNAAGGAVYEELLSGDITVTVGKKTVQKAEIVEPTFNKVYMAYGAATDNGKPYITLDSVKDTLLEGVSDHGGTWSIVSADDTKLYEGANEVELKFTLPAGGNYVGFVSNKQEDANTTWKEEGGNFTFTVKRNVTVSPAADHVISIDDPMSGDTAYETGTIVYNPKVSSAVNMIDLTLNYTGTYNTSTALATAAELKFSSDDDAAVEYVYDKFSKKLRITAKGTTNKPGNIVTITAEDAAGTGLKKEIKVQVLKGVLEGDVAFDAGFAAIPAKKEFAPDLTTAKIFDVDAANKRENDAVPAQKKHIAYAVSGTIAAGSSVTFTGTYTLQPGEKRVAQAGNTYSLSDDPTIIVTKAVSITPFEITEGYITNAINSLKSGNVALNGNSSIGYGANLMDFVNVAYPGIALKLYHIEANGDAVLVDERTDAAATPAVGAHTADYVVKVASTDAVDGNYHIANSLCKDYPISFTVVNKNLTADITLDDGSAIGSLVQETALGSYTLKAVPNAYEGADSHYTYQYQWYKNGSAVQGANAATYAVTDGGTYYCVVTANAIAGQSGHLANTTATTRTIEFIVTNMMVVARTANAQTGAVEVGTTDLGTAPAAVSGTYLTGPGTFSAQVQFSGPDTYAVGDSTTVVLKKNGTVVETKSFAKTAAARTVIEYTPSYDIDAGTYEIWVEAAGTKTVGTVTTAQKYNAKVADYTVAPYDTAIAVAANGVVSDIVEANGTSSLVYGDKPSDKLKYTFKLSNRGTLSAEQVEKIEALVNANVTFAIKDGDKTNRPVGNAGLIVTAAAIQKPSGNINAASVLGGASPKEYTPAAVQINKKDLHLDIDVAEGADGVVWTLNKENDVTASYKAEELVNGETVESLGIKNNYTYKILDADGNDVSKSTIAAGEYTIQLEGVDNVPNYNVIYGSIKLTVVTEITEIHAENILVKTGETAKIVVVSKPGDIVLTDDSVKYVSADETIAAVDEKGVVSGVKAGTTTITVTKDELSPVEVEVTVIDSKTYTEEEMEAVKKAQEEAEAAQKKAEADKAAAEAAKAEAEAAKTQAEADKAATEAAKTQAEADKAAAEAAKTQAEADKAAAEAAKTQAEADKAAAEAAQKKAETDKATAEAAQKKAEAERAAAQAAQKKAETEKAAAQKAQAAAEKKAAVKKGQIVIYGKNIYKITNVSKKTVSFIGTYSTGKSVTVASTIKLGGVSYRVTEIASSALKNNTTVTKVTIGKNVTTIGKSAFSGCTKLKTVSIKSSNVKKIGSSAFKKINATAKIKVPSKKISAYKKLLKGKMPAKAKVSK